MKLIKKFLPDSQYKKEETKKTQIYLHHTAGGHRADLQVDYWANDKIGKVATHYIIGGKSTRNGDVAYDGVVYQTMEEKHWGYHLGLKTSNNDPLNKGSIGIEICNYGYAVKSGDKFISYVGSQIPVADVYGISPMFKMHSFFHKYTIAQIDSLRELILEIAKRHNIPVKKKWDINSFDINADALKGVPGIYTHVNVRKDKFDCHPQKELIEMLNSL